MEITSLPATRPVEAAAKTEDPAKIKQAAQQFEALLMGQILKEMSTAARSGSLGESDSSTSSVLEMAQEQFAQALASRGGLGLTNMVLRDLTPAAAATETKIGKAG
jgi:flagellar protein FlgJ